jgi:deazaflavin-dependent oxidoreductase (nitroreductase family)
MMLEHRGRVTGQPRYVVLEVVDREPRRLFLVSGYGQGSQWLRNILADPAVRVWTGSISAAAGRASLLPGEETQQRLAAYRERNPRAAASLARVLGIPELGRGGPIPADIAQRLPMVAVAIQPALPGQPPG